MHLYPSVRFAPNMDLVTKDAWAVHCCADSVQYPVETQDAGC